jgi:hypothetical protein
MAGLLQRYQNGERREVWNDLTALGDAVRQPQYLREAQGVARETMIRARHNVETLIPRLDKLGYRFHTHLDSMRESVNSIEQAMRLSDEMERMNAGSPAPFGGLGKLAAMIMPKLREQTAGPAPVIVDPLRHPDVWQQPDAATAKRLDDFEQAIGGPLPLSLRAWCETVGAVSFMGSHPLLGQRQETGMKMGFGFGTPTDDFRQFSGAAARAGVELVTEIETADETPLADPLVVQPYFEEWEDGEGEGLLELSLAPDDLHKANISGGDPYGMRIPNAAADGVFSDWNQAYFVEYLRIAFRWGGFPGFARTTQRPELELAYLAEGLLDI